VKNLERWAKIGITVQFLALVRTLSEYFRLEYVLGPRFSLTIARPYVLGALVAALLCWLSVTLFFFRRYGNAVLVSAATVLVLFALKIYWIGW
jgi:preprotein translocase subunit SecF